MIDRTTIWIAGTILLLVLAAIFGAVLLTEKSRLRTDTLGRILCTGSHEVAVLSYDNRVYCVQGRVVAQ